MSTPVVPWRVPTTVSGSHDTPGSAGRGVGMEVGNSGTVRGRVSDPDPVLV